MKKRKNKSKVIIPVSRGGSSESDNLTTSCRDCNREKRAKTPEEWLR